MGIEVGDIAKIYDSGQIYSSMREFAEKYGYPDAVMDDWDDCASIKSKEVEVLFIGNHALDDTQLVAVVELLEAPHHQLMIGIEGLVEDESVYWETLYVTIKAVSKADILIALQAIYENIDSGRTRSSYRDSSAKYEFNIAKPKKSRQ